MKSQVAHWGIVPIAPKSSFRELIYKNPTATACWLPQLFDLLSRNDIVYNNSKNRCNLSTTIPQFIKSGCKQLATKWNNSYINATDISRPTELSGMARRKKMKEIIKSTSVSAIPWLIESSGEWSTTYRRKFDTTITLLIVPGCGRLTAIWAVTNTVQKFR